MTHRDRLADLDRRSLIHPFTSITEHLQQGPRIIVEGRGLAVRDASGREYLDAMAGLWCVNIGYGREEMAETMARQSRRLSYFHSFLGMSNEPAIQLADRLLGLSPRRMRRVFFANSGSEANDSQIKLVWQYQYLRGHASKRKIIARHGGYHGVTLGASSLTGLPAVHESFGLPLTGFQHVTAPHARRYAQEGATAEEFLEFLVHELEKLIQSEGPETVAAFIAEPIMAAGGVIVPPEQYFGAICPVLRRNDILLISDEVVCGFGRLGRWFGCDDFGFEPDLITVAKGLTSAYMPMSGCLISETVWEVLREGGAKLDTFAHGFTTTAHPVAAAVALTNLDIIEREKLLENASRVGQFLQRRLLDLFDGHPLVGEIRGRALIAAIELVPTRESSGLADPSLGLGREWADLVFEEGLIVRPIGNAVALSPALIATERDVEEILLRLRRGLDRLSNGEPRRRL